MRPDGHKRCHSLSLHISATESDTNTTHEYIRVAKGFYENNLMILAPYNTHRASKEIVSPNEVISVRPLREKG
jgi:hypothetical protein